MLGNHQWIKWLIYPITFVASIILIFEIEGRWSSFRKGSSQIETPTEIPTKKDKEPFDYSNLSNQFKILDCCVGYFKLGSQIRYPEASDNYKIRKEIQTRMTEEGPEEENTFTVSIGNEDHINIKMEYNYEKRNYTNNIGELIVVSPKYKTKKGVGVGSTIEEFTRKYPKHHFWFTYVSGMYVVESEDLKIQFILSKDDFVGELDIKSEISPVYISDFKPNSKIIKVRMFKH